MSKPPYCARYCEENVYKLCSWLMEKGSDVDDLRVVFISNGDGQVALWQQRAARYPDDAVLWDYHVILLMRVDGRWKVRDQDSSLGRGSKPVSVDLYVDETFLPLPRSVMDLAPKFRVVSAQEFLAEFASDRGHMQDPDGSWIAPPPDWPPIGTETNLFEFVDMEDGFLGQVMTKEQLLAEYL